MAQQLKPSILGTWFMCRICTSDSGTRVFPTRAKLDDHKLEAHGIPFRSSSVVDAAAPPSVPARVDKRLTDETPDNGEGERKRKLDTSTEGAKRSKIVASTSQGVMKEKEKKLSLIPSTSSDQDQGDSDVEAEEVDEEAEALNSNTNPVHEEDSDATEPMVARDQNSHDTSNADEQASKASDSEELATSNRGSDLEVSVEQNSQGTSNDDDDDASNSDEQTTEASDSDSEELASSNAGSDSDSSVALLETPKIAPAAAAAKQQSATPTPKRRRKRKFLFTPTRHRNQRNSSNTADTSTSARHSKKQERKYDCQYCGKVYNGPYAGTALKFHIRSHTGERPYQCKCCPYKCAQHGQMMDHVRRHHAAELKGLKSGYKPYTYSSTATTPKASCSSPALQMPAKEAKEQLAKKQMKKRQTVPKRIGNTNTKKSKNKHHCDSCGKSFSTGQKLMVHNRSHTGARPYQCKFCPATYAYQQLIMFHAKGQHPKQLKNGDRPYDFVDGPSTARVSSSNSNKRNLKAGGPTRKADKTLKKSPKVSSPEAGTGTNSKKLRRGRRPGRKTTKSRPFKCRICGDGFTLAFNLARHERSHQLRESAPSRAQRQAPELKTAIPEPSTSKANVGQAQRRSESRSSSRRSAPATRSPAQRKKDPENDAKKEEEVKAYHCKFCTQKFASETGVLLHARIRHLAKFIDGEEPYTVKTKKKMAVAATEIED